MSRDLPADPSRIALITGAPRRIGRAIALDLARHGWSIGVHCRVPDADAEATAAAIRVEGVRATIIDADLADQVAVAGILPRLAVELGPCRLLVNNASIFAYDDISTLSAAGWNTALAVNLTAPVLLAQAFAAQLPRAERGNIVNIVDQRVLKPTPHFFAYAASKSALWAATQTLAQALAPAIRVNAIGPGPVLASVHQSAAEFDAQARATLLGHGTTPAEIAAAVRFILDAPAMTGQLILLDGGQHLAWQTPDVGDGRG